VKPRRGTGVKNLNHLLRHLNRNTSQLEVEEELRFHVEMQAHDYEDEGMEREAAAAKARLRFGDFAQIKRECVQIASRDSAGARFMKLLYTLVFLTGVLIRCLALGVNITRVGDVLIMIAVAGGLLLLGKRMRGRNLGTGPEAISLGLRAEASFTPVAFDEKGRTPFERVSEL